MKKLNDALKIAWRWVTSHIYIVGFVVITLVGWVLFGVFRKDKKDPLKEVSDKMEVVKAKNDVHRVKIKQGTQAAVDSVKAKYSKKLEALNEEEKKKARALEDDPDALVDFILGVG